MIVQPHLYVLRYIEKALQNLRARPDHLAILLEGYCINGDVAGIYGARYIDKAIKWIQENEFYYVLANRLDMEKLPCVTVLYEGGHEDTEFLGDFGEYRYVDITPATYVTNLFIKDVDIDGNIIISKSVDITSKAWRGLKLVNGKVSRVIKSFAENSDDDTVVILDSPVSLTDVSLDNWSIISPVNQKTLQLGSSLDKVSIKVMTMIPGDPELADMFSTIMRGLLKQARLYLMNNHLNTPSFSHSSISEVSEHSGTHVWRTMYEINGLLKDTWVLLESTNPDRILLLIDAVSDSADNERVNVWKG